MSLAQWIPTVITAISMIIIASMNVLIIMRGQNQQKSHDAIQDQATITNSAIELTEVVQKQLEENTTKSIQVKASDSTEVSEQLAVQTEILREILVALQKQ